MVGFPKSKKRCQIKPETHTPQSFLAGDAPYLVPGQSLEKFSIDSHGVGQLEDHGQSDWTALPNYLLAWHKFHCQTLQAFGSGQIHDLQGSSELGELRGHRKITSKDTACGESHQGEEKAACQCSNGQCSSQLDQSCQKIGSSPDLCSESG